MTDFPSVGRLAGIDYGSVRIGIAICDARQQLASPLENYTRRGEEADARHFQEIVEREDVVGFVIGLPVHTDGLESQKSLEARRFAAWLSDVTKRPVRFYDERYTTQQATELLTGSQMTRKRRKKRLDMIAAQLILAAFLESDRTHDASQSLDD